MKKTNEEFSILYDFYGELLSERQREAFELYYEENFSLSEVADIIGVSRQAVHITLGNANRELEKYDKKLRLIEKQAAYEEKLNDVLMEIDLLLKNKEQSEGLGAGTAKELKQIKELIRELEI